LRINIIFRNELDLGKFKEYGPTVVAIITEETTGFLFFNIQTRRVTLALQVLVILGIRRESDVPNGVCRFALSSQKPIIVCNTERKQIGRCSLEGITHNDSWMPL
jgi:hypothetical protein